MTEVHPMQVGTIGVTTGVGPWYDQVIGRAIRWTTATRRPYERGIDADSTFTNAPVNHAVIFVGDGHLVEARPGGARVSPWKEYGEKMTWLPQLYQAGTGRVIAPTARQRDQIAKQALSLASHHIGYNYLDFVAIALAQRRLGQVVDPAKPPWWARRLSDDNRMICSQLVDFCYNAVGIKLFNDNRLPGLVSPGDLYGLSVLQP